MSKFKVGDKVRCINNKNYSHVEVGDILEITQVEAAPELGGGYLLAFRGVCKEIAAYEPQYFELAERAPYTTPDGKPLASDTKDTNPKDGAATSRLDLSLVPQTAVAYMALAFTEGALKYGAYNWRDAGVLASVYVAAALRHIYKWYNGEECDPDTGVPHLASAQACLAVLIDAKEIGKLKDDRPPIASLGIVLKEFEHKVKVLQQKFPNGPKRHTESGR